MPATTEKPTVLGHSLTDLNAETRRRLQELQAEQPIKLDLSQSICLALKLKKPGVTRKVDSTQIEVDADSETLTVSKEIINSESLKKLRSHDVAIRKYLNEHAVPAKFLAAGMCIVPSSQLVIIDAQLQIMLAERDAIREQFREEYAGLVEAAKETLRALYDENDYPPVDVICASIAHEYRYLTINKPKALESISAEIAKREEKRSQERIEAITLQVEGQLIEGARQLTEQLIERLSPSETGETKRLRDTSINAWREFYTGLQERNITKNKTIAQIAELGMAAIGGLSADDLRRSDLNRKGVVDLAKDILPLIDAAVINKPKRAVILED